LPGDDLSELQLKSGSVSRFLFAVCLAAAAVKSDDALFIAAGILLAAVALIVWTGRIASILEAGRLIFLFFVFIFLLHLFSHPGRELFSLTILTATTEGAMTGLFYGMKLIVFVLSAYIILLCVKPFDLVLPVERLARILGRYGRPVSYLAISLSLALRFLPDLVRQAGVTRLAFRSRGVTFDGGILQRSRSAVQLVAAVFVNTFKQAETTALALAVKGYSVRYRRAVLPPFNVTISGSFAVVAGFAFLIWGWR
jgi:energy-coupling factor transport system permease protein